MAPQGGNPFTAFTGTDAPDTASFNSMISSLMADTSIQAVASSTVSPTPTSNAVTTSQASVQQSSSILSTVSPSSRLSQTSQATVVISASGTSSATVGTITSAATASTATATNAASDSHGSISSEACHSVSCSPGLKAAIAVPVVVGVLAIAALLFFLARRRRRSQQAPVSRSEKPTRKWTRHLGIFSFDNELVGGQTSSTNSMRSRDSNQQLNGPRQPGEHVSPHRIEEAAPPYTTSQAQHPSMVQTGPGLAAGALAATAIPRSTSGAGAPPPYGQTVDAPRPHPQDSAVPAGHNLNPFSDPPNTNPIILIDGSCPFRDPSDDEGSLRSRPALSRNSSMRTGLEGDDTSMLNGSDAGSIREAQIGRHMSVTSGGRTIQNVRNSQSPTTSAANSAEESNTDIQT